MHWVFIFFVVAIVAAIFGFGGIASASVGIAQTLFVLFVLMGIAAFFMRRVK